MPPSKVPLITEAVGSETRPLEAGSLVVMPDGTAATVALFVVVVVLAVVDVLVVLVVDFVVDVFLVVDLVVVVVALLFQGRQRWARKTKWVLRN